MKTIISTAIIASILTVSCNNSAKQEAQIQAAKQQTLDSINQVQTTARLEQLRQDSIKHAEKQQHSVASSNNNNNGSSSSSEPQTAEQKKKKGMMMKAAMADSAPTPEVEAGTSQVSMSADGVIEVLQ